MQDREDKAIAFKSENEVDELEDDNFSEDFEGEESEVHDVPLQPPTVQMLTTKTLHTMIHNADINLDPPYQRDLVWSESKQVALIDSVFRNFFIPPVIFAVQHDSDGVEVRMCVDGKQRLSSIQRFIDGQIPHVDTRTKKKYYFQVSPKDKDARTQVPPRLRNVFHEKKITVVEYHGIAPGMERDVFQRVQMGMPLTAAEKLQAISSSWAEWIRQLESKHISTDGGLADVLKWDIKRGRDFQNLAHMVFCCDGLPDQTLPTAQKMEKWMNRDDRPPRQFQEDMDNVLRCLWFLSTHDEYSQGFKKIPQRIAPVEFIFMGVLLYVLRKENYDVQAKAIYRLRQTIRQEFKDIRNNSDVGKAMWKHIDTLRHKPNTLLKPNESNVRNKRKRNSIHNEEEEEFRPKPMKGIGKPLKTRAKQSKT
ncbi:hypothetical protein CPB84DRAFT_1758056 [Gymnopilus junonius]|uniref:GmrSD restriction endonucleases N-terminal domain-containing protein n=1 Tax=Gymnopilus junonius TaxID=109634 RepID=A0A9P5P1H4_GYMJU|nr:hypothetical protein CPB84DRAFT_1758056 [Gymnopilus junonius]